MGGGSSDAEASSCLDEANHSLTLARARRKVCVHLRSSSASLGRADKHNGRAVLSGSKGPTIAWCPANGRTVGVCSNLDDLVDLVDLANPLSMTSTAVAAMSGLLSLASACFYLLKCKLHFALRFAFRAPSMTGHWPRGETVCANQQSKSSGRMTR